MSIHCFGRSQKKFHMIATLIKSHSLFRLAAHELLLGCLHLYVFFFNNAIYLKEKKISL